MRCVPSHPQSWWRTSIFSVNLQNAVFHPKASVLRAQVSTTCPSTGLVPFIGAVTLSSAAVISLSTAILSLEQCLSLHPVSGLSLSQAACSD